MASAPDYDPRVMSGVTNLKDYKLLHDDPAKPLLNRATQGVYPPGSTWKVLMSIAALEEKAITPTTVINCPGSLTYGGHVWHCDKRSGHGGVRVRQGIQVSCDVFFYQVVLRLGLDNLDKWAKKFHFGERLTTDINEAPTLLPTKAYYDKQFGVGKWTQGRIINLGIGQGELGVNPLQLAAYAAAVANGGTWHAPRLVRAIRNKRLNELEEFPDSSENLGIDPKIMELVRGGMYDVVNVPGGTGGAAKLDSIQVAGKTGTAQAGIGKKDHAWFICFAPFDHPKIAMCVLVENSGFGGQISAPIARKLVRYYLTRQKEPGDLSPTSDDYIDGLAAGALPAVGDVQESAKVPDSASIR
jgi:penicillin-binding protein 2